MATKKDRDRDNARDVERIRLIVATLDHDETLIVQRALMAYATMLDVADLPFPNPDQRAMGSRSDELGQLFQRANTARAYVNDKDQITSA